MKKTSPKKSTPELRPADYFFDLNNNDNNKEGKNKELKVKSGVRSVSSVHLVDSVQDNLEDIFIGSAVEKSETESSENKEDGNKGSYGGKSDAKSIIILISVVVGLFAISLAGFSAYNHFTGSAVVSIDDLHSKNIEGELKTEEGIMYNGYSFIKADGLWWTEFVLRNTLIKTPLHFNPLEVEHIQFSGKLDPGFDAGNEIYVTIDPNIADKYYSLSLTELSFNIAKGINRYPIGACTQEHPVCENRTIISCADTQGLPVIEIVPQGEPGINF